MESSKIRIPGAGNGGEKRPVVLIVDDDDMALKAVNQLLTKRGFEIITALNGREGLEKLGQHPVDVMVLDVQMPEMTGLEVCQILRSDGRYAELPVILLTGCDDHETRYAGMNLGVSEFICKPFAVHELIERINNQLEVRRIQKQLESLESKLGTDDERA